VYIAATAIEPSIGTSGCRRGPGGSLSWAESQQYAVFAKTPEPLYYAVIFSAKHSGQARAAYDGTAERMIELAVRQPGFLGMETVRGDDGFGITVSYWMSDDAIAAWKAHAEHTAAQEAGKSTWYDHYELRVAKVERAYGKA
jgi:heme-degrading monooxygenase HmoA